MSSTKTETEPLFVASHLDGDADGPTNEVVGSRTRRRRRSEASSQRWWASVAPFTAFAFTARIAQDERSLPNRFPARSSCSSLRPRSSLRHVDRPALLRRRRRRGVGRDAAAPHAEGGRVPGEGAARRRVQHRPRDPEGLHGVRRRGRPRVCGPRRDGAGGRRAPRRPARRRRHQPVLQPAGVVQGVRARAVEPGRAQPLPGAHGARHPEQGRLLRRVHHAARRQPPPRAAKRLDRERRVRRAVRRAIRRRAIRRNSARAGKTSDASSARIAGSPPPAASSSRDW